jgi:hypothetical protein
MKFSPLIVEFLFSKHSLKVIPYLILMKFSALNAEINIASSSYNFQIIYFINVQPPPPDPL